MACYKLTSCTAGNNTVIYTNTNLAAYVGISVEIMASPGACFTVELSDPPCDCTAPIPVVVTLPDCICTTSYSCYILSDCNAVIAPFYVSSNLNPYVGTTVSVFEYPGECFNVIGVTDSAACAENLPVPVYVTCVAPCVCGPTLYCYEITNCLNPLQVITINTTLSLTLGNVIQPTPAIIPPGGNNCWTVTADNLSPCTGGTGTNVTAVVDYGVDGCVSCAGPPICYQLLGCNGTDLQYSNSNLAAFAGGSPIATTVFPGQCWYVTVAPPMTCSNPVIIDPITVSPCSCPCYTLTNCRTGVVIQSNSDLAAFVGQSVHIDPPNDTGCTGDCWLVALSGSPCVAPVAVRVTLGCVPCGPCGETCYELIDCETNVVFMTVLNPTTNGVDLSTLISGQSIGKIQDEFGVDTFGCWYVNLATDCTSAVTASVFNIYQPSGGDTGCFNCLNSCYGLLNCETLAIDYVIKYTVANPYGLPNPATLTGAIGSLCFEAPTGCVTGCYQLQLIPGVSCVGSVDWSTVVSMVPYQDCFSCLPPCYLLTECAPGIPTPFVVNNDFSLYVGNVVKLCDAQGVCKCYFVELAQTCVGSFTIQNTSASFSTCAECNSCDCPPGYTKVGDNCQKITSVSPTVNNTIYTSAPGSVSANYGNLGTNFYDNLLLYSYPVTAVGTTFEDPAANVVPTINVAASVWSGPAGSRLNSVGVWTTVAPNPLGEWIGFSHCLNVPADGPLCIGIAGDKAVRIKIDGILVVLANVGAFDYNYWHVFEINFTQGTHIVTMEGYNTGGTAAFGAEIYNATSALLQVMVTPAQVQAVTLFSTFNYRVGGVFQIGEDSGYTCAPGYALNTCGPAPLCSLVETVPFTDCAPTYLVTHCLGTQAPFYTNSDLSAYLGDSYKVCINNTYSTTCFLLKDCTRQYPDMYTNTDLNAYLWQVIAVQGKVGGCFIVTGVLAGDPCIAPQPVLVEVPPIPCNCPGAQSPWPNGCYCVTVTTVTPPIVAPDFVGSFDTVYTDCQACLQVCYELTDCTGGVNSVIVTNDLAAYVGQVIQIASCGDICWQVALSPTCVGAIPFAGAITPFATCVSCLPPAPPTPPPFDLHLRKIKPGWNSPNRCLTLEYIEKTNCSFADAVYDAMLVNRYGITVCCDNDLDALDVKKQLLDLDMLKDPTLCKSTLCCCPAPCVLEAIIAVLPYCGAPNIVSAVIDMPCVPPVLIDAEIEVPAVPADCFCFSVSYVGVDDITVTFMDCCCVVQTVVLPGGATPPGTVGICATTTPFTYDLPGGPCGCPVGFTYNPMTGLCEEVTTGPPNVLNPKTIVHNTPAIGGSGEWGANLYPDITVGTFPILSDPLIGIPNSPPAAFSPSPPYPFQSVNYPQLTDNALVPFVPTNNIPNTLANQTWGCFRDPFPGLGVIPGGRFTATTIWNSDLPHVPFEWWGISFCVNIPVTKTYILGFSVAEYGRLSLDGVLKLDLQGTGWNFGDFKLFPITLTAGNRVFKLEAQEGALGVGGGIAFEIYDATFAQLAAVASPAALAPYILFNTLDLVGRTVTSGDTTGMSCNPGGTLDFCGAEPVCEYITTAPYVPCLDVVNLGLCSEVLLCNPPAPLICKCWKIENLGLATETYSVGLVCPADLLGSSGTLLAGSPALYICSIATPTVSAGMTVTDMGPCDGYCGPVPIVCVCYHLTSDAGTCEFNYTDCNGVPQTVTPPTIGPASNIDYYLCSSTMPTFDALGCGMINFNMQSTPFNCTGGICGPPFPCDCYVVSVNDVIGVGLSFWYYDCDGVYHLETVFSGTYYRCGSNFGSLNVDVTFAISTLNCGLGECVDPYAICVCYEITTLGNGFPTEDVTYLDCNGVIQLESLPIGKVKRCALNTPASSPPGSATVVVTSTPLNCALDECV